MADPRIGRSYSIEDLERETGFDRRTIAYYIQEDLLPRVGRRGPRTRYPRHVRDRLMFIRKLREVEETGGIRPVSLNNVRRIFDSLSDEIIAAVADGDERLLVQFIDDLAVPARPGGARERMLRYQRAHPAGRGDGPQHSRSRKPGAAAAVDEPLLRYARSGGGSRTDPRDGAADPLLAGREENEFSAIGSALGDTLAAIESAAGRSDERGQPSAQVWSRIEVTPDLAVSVRGLSDQDTQLLEELRKQMRDLLRQARRK